MSLLTRVDLRGADSNLEGRLPRPAPDRVRVRSAVEEILADVAQRGDEALVAATARFDGVELTPDALWVPAARIAEAVDDLTDGLRAAIETARARIRDFHERALPTPWQADVDGGRFGQRFTPIHRVGVYAPGGLAAYPSTVLMATIPARVAGVDEIVLATPPTGGDGWPNRAVLGVAGLLGVDRVLRVGGAQAVAALAGGTERVPACDKVVGPGNVYVTQAKQLVAAAGSCGIDTGAGPTEVAILADETADARVVAADLVAQAEHDELASCLLVTPSQELVADVEDALAAEVAATRHRQRVEAALAGQGSAALVDDLEQGVAVVDAFAPEHLEVQTVDAERIAERVRYAGAIFVGADTPVSLGDYAAGPNHTLPTSGAARFSGGLTTADFLVSVNWVSHRAEGLAALADTVREFAAAEDLPAHARAVDVRLDSARD